MSTQVEPKAQSETETTVVVDPNQAKVDALLKDETVVIDNRFVELFLKIAAQEKIEGGKWYKLIIHTRDVLMAKHEEKEAMSIILKSLLSQGKTYSTAQSIRSYVVKMAKPENAEILEKLNTGTITVRESRQFGRKAQVNPAKTNEDKFNEACASVARYASAIDGMTVERIIAKVNESCSKYFKAGKA